MYVYIHTHTHTRTPAATQARKAQPRAAPTRSGAVHPRRPAPSPNPGRPGAGCWRPPPPLERNGAERPPRPRPLPETAPAPPLTAGLLRHRRPTRSEQACGSEGGWTTPTVRRGATRGRGRGGGPRGAAPFSAHPRGRVCWQHPRRQPRRRRV